MSLLAHTPNFSATDAERLAGNLYGVDGPASPLTSERDQNFLLRPARGDAFVLKIANALEDPAFLDAQRQAMTLAADRTSLCARVLPLATGDGWMREGRGSSGARHFVRLLSFIPGTPAGEVRRPSAEYRRDLGKSV